MFFHSRSLRIVLLDMSMGLVLMIQMSLRIAHEVEDDRH